jgi:hypothetical protein
MSHSYPLADSAEAALKAGNLTARTRADAERLADGRQVERLETEWLSLDDETSEEALKQASAHEGQGFIQRYEDDTGAPVLAVTYWKLAPKTRKASGKSKSSKSAPLETEKPNASLDATDHTDDLYFRSGRTKPRRRQRPVDPNQLDLFGSNAGEETG